MAFRLGEAASHCQATVTDVVVESGGKALIADLFVATGGLVIVFYTPCPGFPKWSEGAATLAGGVGAGLGMAFIRFNESSNARAIAAAMRAQDTGLSLRERIRRRGGLVFLREEIRSVESDPRGQMIRLTVSPSAYRSGMLVVAVTNADDTKRAITRSLAGSLRDEEDTLAVNAGLPSAGEMLAWIEQPSRSPGIQLNDCARAADLPDYCKELVKQLRKRRWPQRERLCQLVKDRSAPLARSMGMALTTAEELGSNALILSGCSTLIALPIGLSLMLSAKSSDHSPGRWLLLGGAGLSILTLMAFTFVRRDRQRNMQLAARLLDVDTSQIKGVWPQIKGVSPLPEQHRTGDAALIAVAEPGLASAPQPSAVGVPRLEREASALANRTVTTLDNAIMIYQDCSLNSPTIASPAPQTEIQLGAAKVVDGREWVEATLPNGDRGYALGPNVRGHSRFW